MKKLPLSIWLAATVPASGPQEIVCHRILRVLSGTREVFDAVWDGRNVIAKVFHHPLKARRHCRREARGLRRLAERGIDAPVLLHAGRTADGHWAVVTEKIEDAVSLTVARERFDDPQYREEILRSAAGLLATMHQRGVVQVDFHATNFLLQGTRLIVIDPGQIRFRKRPVARGLALRQIACLAHILLPGEPPQSAELLCTEYARLRGWQFNAPAWAAFRRMYRTTRAKGIRRGLNRLLEKGKQHIRIKQRDYRTIVHEDFHASGDFGTLIERIDGLIEAGRILKCHGSVLVAQVVWAHREIVVTRFDEAGVRHALAERWRGSPARRRWLAAHLLGMLGVATARPLAFIERRTGPWRQRSYLLTEKVEGQTLHELLSADEVSRQWKQKALGQLADALDRLANYGVTYRDSDLTGIRVSKDRLIFVGVGHIVTHWFPGRCRRQQTRERGRMVETLRAAGFDVQESGLRTPGGAAGCR
jgi:tRNA A-37 threonylcarbamoyl transferase component Bud32